jgi:hypothetical protein
MTTCTPLRPFRCWQYRKGEPVPDWAKHIIDFATRCDPPLEEGTWLFEFDTKDRRWYTHAEFAERFRVTNDT